MFFAQSRKSKKVPSIQITAPVTNTLEALDLHSPACYSLNNTDQRRGSLGDSDEHDLVSNLNYKSHSDTQLNEDGNANKTRAQNLNWTKTFATIDNKYDRARVATNQEAVKKKVNLIQRRISMELKVDHLEKSIQSPEKKSSQSVQRSSPSSPTRVKKRVEELKSQLKTIDADLKATDKQREVAIKGIYANKNKEYDVIHLLEETARVHSKHNMDKKPIGDKREVTSPNTSPRNSFQVQISDKRRNTERRRTISRLQAFSNVLDIRRPFKSSHRANKNNNHDCSFETAQSIKSKVSQNSNQRELSKMSTMPLQTIKEKRIGDTSETSSSSDEDGEIKTVISEKALQEIAAFEKLIEVHMNRRREFDDILYIDEDEYTVV